MATMKLLFHWRLHTRDLKHKDSYHIYASVLILIMCTDIPSHSDVTPIPQLYQVFVRVPGGREEIKLKAFSHIVLSYSLNLEFDYFHLVRLV